MNFNNDVKASVKAQIIIEMCRREVDLAYSKYINATADLARAEMGKKMWDEREKEEDNIGFSQNPYNVDTSRKQSCDTLADLNLKKAVLRYAVDEFVAQIKDEDEVEK